MFRICLVMIVFLLTSCSGTPEKKEQKEADKNKTEMASQPTSTSSVNPESQLKKKTILFFGDSLTAGFGLEEEEAFPALIQNRLDSMGMAFQVINAGLSGETSAGGKGRIEWVLNRPIDIFVLELGANDMLRGLALDETNKNLRAILDKVNELSPQAKLIIAGMEAPANMGQDYVSGFKKMYAEIADEYNAAFIPFLLEGLLGEEDMSIGDGKHPNAEGQKIVRENVWKVLNQFI